MVTLRLDDGQGVEHSTSKLAIGLSMASWHPLVRERERVARLGRRAERCCGLRGRASNLSVDDLVAACLVALSLVLLFLSIDSSPSECDVQASPLVSQSSASSQTISGTD